MRAFLIVSLCLSLVGCFKSSGLDDAGVDAGTDTSRPDTGVRVDAGPILVLSDFDPGSYSERCGTPIGDRAAMVFNAPGEVPRFTCDVATTHLEVELPATRGPGRFEIDRDVVTARYCDERGCERADGGVVEVVDLVLGEIALVSVALYFRGVSVEFEFQEVSSWCEFCEDMPPPPPPIDRVIGNITEMCGPDDGIIWSVRVPAFAPGVLECGEESEAYVDVLMQETPRPGVAYPLSRPAAVAGATLCFEGSCNPALDGEIIFGTFELGELAEGRVTMFASPGVSVDVEFTALWCEGEPLLCG